MASAIEKIIQDAIEQGQFDDLPGQGQPLALEEYAFEDPASASAHRLLKGQGFSLPWIALGQAINKALVEATRELTQRLAWIAQRGVALAESGRWHRVKQTFRERIGTINGQIEEYNLSVPLPRFQRRPIDADKIIERIVGAGIAQDE
jgi:hypothetical protein